MKGFGHNLNLGEDVTAYFYEHSIPSQCRGVITEMEGDWITVHATDGWHGEAGAYVRVPFWRIQRERKPINHAAQQAQRHHGERGTVDP